MDKVEKQIREELELDNCLRVSAKTGQNVEHIIPRIIDLIPPPVSADVSKPFKALLFDSWHNEFKGVVGLISVISGKLRKNDKIISANSRHSYIVNEVGIMHPEHVEKQELYL